MESYDSAALRHYNDAKFLNSSGKLDNAGHLIGFAAECAIKYKISTLPSSQDNPHGHFPSLLIIARKHLTQRSGHTTSMLNFLKSDILHGWTVNRRYDKTGATSQDELDKWIAETGRLFACANLKANP